MIHGPCKGYNRRLINILHIYQTTEPWLHSETLMVWACTKEIMPVLGECLYPLFFCSIAECSWVFLNGLRSVIICIISSLGWSNHASLPFPTSLTSRHPWYLAGAHCIQTTPWPLHLSVGIKLEILHLLAMSFKTILCFVLPVMLG